jgi:hypothetical protein
MRRRFTVEQANRTLPLVRRIVEDIVGDYGRWQEQVRAFESAAAATRSGELSVDAAQLQRQAQSTASQIDGYVRELEALGLEFKGFDLGLVDFPGEIDGRPVYLCWRLGEPAVQFWHEIDGGYTGRRPVAPLAAV